MLGCSQLRGNANGSAANFVIDVPRIAAVMIVALHVGNPTHVNAVALPGAESYDGIRLPTLTKASG